MRQLVRAVQIMEGMRTHGGKVNIFGKCFPGNTVTSRETKQGKLCV